MMKRVLFSRDNGAHFGSRETWAAELLREPEDVESTGGASSELLTGITTAGGGDNRHQTNAVVASACAPNAWQVSQLGTQSSMRLDGKPNVKDN
jgi:hypothetical protein